MNHETKPYSEDVLLMLAVKGGCSSAMDKLYQRHRDRVIKLLHSVVRNREVAVELSQDVFLNVYQARHNYQPTAEFTTWIYRIALNRGLKWLRQQKIQRQESLEVISPGAHRQLAATRIPTPEHILLNKEKSRTIADAIDALPRRQKAAVLMHKYEDYDYHQIGQELDCSLTAVKSILFRTYSSLRQQLPAYR